MSDKDVKSIQVWILCSLHRAACRSLYHCNYCQKDISSCPRIKCAVCTDFDLCLECFAVGCEITPHKRDHDYRVIDNLNFPIYHPDWGVRDLNPGGVFPLVFLMR